MTEKEIKKIRQKISRIKSNLNAQKRKFGWIDDSRGTRYIPPGLFIRLKDFKGGLNYMNWFHDNFPDDAGFPDFLFEWAFILFQNGKFTETKRKILETYFSNTYVIDKFFNRPIKPLEKSEFSNVESPEFCEYFEYSALNQEFGEFATWLREYEQSEEYNSTTTKFVELRKLLSDENDMETRTQIIDQEDKLIE